MKQAEKIKFAIIGCGHIGKKMAAVIDACAGLELAALCDARSQNEVSIDNVSVPFYNDINDLLANADFDVLCLATPNGLHTEHAIAAIRNGRHVLVEKPMALAKEDCRKIIETAEEYGRQVFCVMQNRYSDVSQWLKTITKQGVLGKIFMVQVNCYWNRDERYYKRGSWHGTKQLDGGVLFTQFSHFIDMLYWLFGDVTNITSHMDNFRHEDLTEFEDSGFINFEFVRGGMGCFNFSTAVWQSNLESSITIIAEKGTVKVSGQYMDKVEHCNISNYEMPLEINKPLSTGSHELVFNNIAGVLNGNCAMDTTPAEAMKVVDIIERMYNSAAKDLLILTMNNEPARNKS